MKCPEHTLCAFTGAEVDLCAFCHAPWSKITAPASWIETRTSVSRKTGERITVEDVHHLDGYGEPPLNHFWRHAIDAKRSERSAVARSARKQAAA